MDFSVEDKLFIENFIKKNKRGKSQKGQENTGDSERMDRTIKKCDEVELYIIKDIIYCLVACSRI